MQCTDASIFYALKTRMTNNTQKEAIYYVQPHYNSVCTTKLYDAQDD